MSSLAEIVTELRATIAEQTATIGAIRHAKLQPAATIGALDDAEQRANIALQKAVALLEMITGVPIEPPPEPEPSVMMELYSQNNELWRDDIYAGGLTFGQGGCLVCSADMIASLAGYTDTPPEFAAKLREVGAFSGALLNHPERIPDAYPLLRYDGTVNWRNVPADLGILQDELNVGPVIVEVEFVPGGAQPPDDQHFVVAEMFSADGGDLVVADPWTGTRIKLLEKYAKVGWGLARCIYGLRLLRVAEG